jgi:hypothetical protein
MSFFVKRDLISVKRDLISVEVTSK